MLLELSFEFQLFLIISSQILFHIFRTVEINWIAKGYFWKSVFIGWLLTICFLFSTWVGVVSINQFIQDLTLKNTFAIIIFIASVSIGRIIGMKFIQKENGNGNKN